VQDLLANPLRDWITALIIVAVVFAVLLLGRMFVARRLKRSLVPASQLRALLTDLVRRTRLYFMVVIALWAGSLELTRSEHHEHVWRLIVLVVVLLQVGLWAGGLVGFWTERIADHKAADAGTRMTINVVGIAARVLLWIVVLLVILDNLGINITALVTGLGIGGIAIALAVQNILGDLFAALSIVLDKPIVVGDAISVGEVSGTVLHIGLKSTRLRANTGELVIISNGDLLKSRIRNFRGQERRMVALKLGIAYGTPADKLAKVPEIIRSAAAKEKNVTFDRSNFTSFDYVGLTTDSLYYVTNSSYAEYMDIQQRINLDILRQLDAESIDIAHQLPIVANPPAVQPQ
jgi:small-conductance mechanosensitive channel